METHYLSPLRYPGGKRKLANFIRAIFRQNNLLDGEYIEPYAGGASVALSLLFGEFASRIHLNDFDPSISTFWRVVLDSPDSLCGRIRDVSVTVEEWMRQRAVQDGVEPDPVDLAFSTFFLNRTNRSGIIRGGVIGGIRQDGPWSIDARFNKEELIGRIEKIARYRSRIEIYGQDGAEFISSCLPRLTGRALVYLDPPYYVKGGGLYEHNYRHEDHVKVAALVSAIRQPWVVSYDHVPAVLEMYANYRRVIYGINYSAQERYLGKEIMFFSPDLQLPDVEDPGKLKGSVQQDLKVSD